MENRKIKGATRVIYNDIKFLSKLEKNCYILLQESGLKFDYSSTSFKLLDSFTPTISIYAPRKKLRSTYRFAYELELSLITNKIRAMTYTPDFIVYTDTLIYYFDVKGSVNDVYPIKKKLFLNQINTTNSAFFEPHSLKQMRQAIDIIKLNEQIINKN